MFGILWTKNIKITIVKKHYTHVINIVTLSTKLYKFRRYRVYVKMLLAVFGNLDLTFWIIRIIILVIITYVFDKYWVTPYHLRLIPPLLGYLVCIFSSSQSSLNFIKVHWVICLFLVIILIISSVWKAIAAFRTTISSDHTIYLLHVQDKLIV